MAPLCSAPQRRLTQAVHPDSAVNVNKVLTDGQQIHELTPGIAVLFTYCHNLMKSMEEKFWTSIFRALLVVTTWTRRASKSWPNYWTISAVQ